MTRTIRTQFRDFNPNFLFEELDLVLPANSVTLGGFDEVSSRLKIPSSEPKVVSRRDDASGVTEDIAQPGEIWVETRSALTVGEATALDAALAVHDETGRSAQQIKDDDNATDLDQLVIDRDDWSSYNNNQKFAACERILKAFLYDQGR